MTDSGDLGRLPRIIVLGRQGAGKGTQCILLARRLGVPHISTGDLFRAEVAAGTTLGRRVRDRLDAGALVPDCLVLDVVSARLRGAGGYLLDGFPRTLAQATGLFAALGDDAADVAVELYAPEDVVRSRLAARRVCRGCGAVSTAAAGSPLVTACVRCGGVVARRDDDTDDAITTRLAAYQESTGPLLVWLDSRGLLVNVSAADDPEAVHEQVLEAVAPYVPVPPRPALTSEPA